MRSALDRAARRDDSGFTLLEVVVAVVLLGLVMAGVSSFFFKGIATAADRERRAAGVALADQTMELVRAVPAVQTGGVQSKLLQGRKQSETMTRWTSAIAPTTELSDSEPAYATSVPAGTFIPVPFESTHTVGTETFVVHTYIGTCQRTNAQSGQCTKSGSGAQVFRVVVQVIWDQGPGTTCSGARCEYIISTLIDPSTDPVFNSNSIAVLPPVPVADDDAATTAFGTAVSIDVLNGDTGDLEPAPVTILTPSPSGTVTGQPSNPVTFTPSAGYHGTTTFTYQLTDRHGRTSNSATVTVTVNPPSPPVANNDTVAGTVLPGSVRDIDVLANDTNVGSGDTITATSPSGGTVSQISRGVFRWTAPTAAGTYTFTYTVRENTAGQASTATVRLTVALPPKPVAVNDSATVPRSSGVDINLLGNDTNTGNVTGIALGSVSGGGSVAATATTGVVRFTAGSSAGTATFTYTLSDAYGQTSTATVTVTVTASAPRPTVVSGDVCVESNTSATYLVVTNFSSSSAPYTWTLVSGAPPGLFSFDQNTGRLTFNAPGGEHEYTFTYRVTDRFGQQSLNGVVEIEVEGDC